MNIPPPPKRPPADQLDAELYDMVKATERGFVQFPPPPVHGAAPAKREKPADTMRSVTLILICIALAIPVLSAWYLLK